MIIKRRSITLTNVMIAVYLIKVVPHSTVETYFRKSEMLVSLMKQKMINGTTSRTSIKDRTSAVQMKSLMNQIVTLRGMTKNN